MKNEFLLWFGSWTSRLGNIIFDYANSISIVTAFTQNPKILALYQSAEYSGLVFKTKKLSFYNESMLRVEGEPLHHYNQSYAA
ncbi:MAG: hypothetical protein E7282_01520 [Lachnospiraceae bacterium]|nr:hypothetical protein [Lachnospiraceae bacterium]